MEEAVDFASQLFAPNMIPIESVMPPRPSPLVLLRQNSLSIEQVYKNGISKKVHVVVKNHPFLIQVGLVSSVWEGQKLDLNRYTMDARLVYDNDSLKEVGFVKLKPIEFKAHVSDRGDQATIEIRPKVLTSQLEDMLFRVMILALDQTTKKPINGLAIVSEPIKVVSKPEQVKKKKEPTKEKKPAKEKVEKVKKTVEQIMSEGLSRIESNVLNHDKLLGLLATAEVKPKEEPIVAPVVSLPLPQKKVEIVTVQQTPFEKAFWDFINACEQLDSFERPEKIRKVLKSSSPSERDDFTEMVSIFQSPSASAPADTSFANKDLNSSGKCTCDTCPHREELIRIDEFYNGFLTAPEIL